MAKAKKHEVTAPVNPYADDSAAKVEPGADKPSQTAPVEPKKPAIVRKNPQLFLKDSNGNEFKFTHFTTLPKRASVAGNYSIDGQDTPFQITSNKGWAISEDKVIHYSWFKLPAGHIGYITHDYCVVPVAGQSFTVHEGVTKRADPTREGKSETEAKRIEAFRATMTVRNAGGSTAQPAEAVAEAAPAA